MLFENACSCQLLDLLYKLTSDNLFNDYILAGGTALALQIGHRKSVDIDLFTTQNQNNEDLICYFKNNGSIYKSIDIINNGKNILQLYVNDIKIDLISVTGKMVEMPIKENGITIFNKKDIAGMKLNAITDRKEPKDYIDIVYLLKELPLDEMFDIYQRKYDADIDKVKEALLQTYRILPDRWQTVEMIKNEVFISDIPDILRDEVKKYNKNKRGGIGRFFSYF